MTHEEIMLGELRNGRPTFIGLKGWLYRHTWGFHPQVLFFAAMAILIFGTAILLDYSQTTMMAVPRAGSVIVALGVMFAALRLEPKIHNDLLYTALTPKPENSRE